VVVGGRPNERGVVSAASYEARKFGVHSAMPLRTAYKLCPHAIFVDGHPERYRQYSERVFEVLNSFTPKLEMASIDEAYLDMTGTERLHGPPLSAAHKLHDAVRERTQLKCSIGMAASRLVAKVASDQAKPNGVLWVLPGTEAAFLAPLDVRKIPGVGKVMEKNLNDLGVRTVADLAQLEPVFLEEHFGKWGLALAGKAQGEDAGGWFDAEIGERGLSKSISHEHTYSHDESSDEVIESTLARLSEMVARRLREQRLHTRTIQLKLRYEDFTTITRAHTLPQPTQIDTEIFHTVRDLFYSNRERGSESVGKRKIRLLGVHAGSLVEREGQLDLLEGTQRDKWNRALAAADDLRQRYGESAVSLASDVKGAFRERTHENPAGLPGRSKPAKEPET
jgi:DNA polymerase-4